ncbi:MAG: PAS domain S-box protein [Methanomicrobiales archaeon]
MLSRFFGKSEAGYKSLIETATNTIVVFASLNRIIIWNPAAVKMFGYLPSEAVVSSFVQLLIPDEYADRLSCNPGSSLYLETDSDFNNPLDIVVRRKDLSTYPAKIVLYRYSVTKSRVCTGIIRDLNEAQTGRSDEKGKRGSVVFCAQDQSHQRMDP